MKSTDCPKWEGCSASVCPLDCSGKHRKRERICFYVMEYVKPGSTERFRMNGFEQIHNRIKHTMDWLIFDTTISKKPSADLTKRLRKAALTNPIMICQAST